jgi:hypothetical protein
MYDEVFEEHGQYASELIQKIVQDFRDNPRDENSDFGVEIEGVLNIFGDDETLKQANTLVKSDDLMDLLLLLHSLTCGWTQQFETRIKIMENYKKAYLKNKKKQAIA